MHGASHIRAVTRGLIAAGILLGVAVTGASGLFLTIAITRSETLVSWLPVALIAFFTVVTMAVLLKDAAARAKGRASGHRGER